MEQREIAQKTSEWLSARLQMSPSRAKVLGQEFAAYLFTAAMASTWEGSCQYCGEPARGRGSTLCWFHYVASLHIDTEEHMEHHGADPKGGMSNE